MSDFDVNDAKLAQLIINWLRDKIPSFINKKVNQKVIDEFDKIQIPADGISVTDVYLENKNLIVKLSNENLINVGSVIQEPLLPIDGIDGKDGINGVSIVDAKIEGVDLILILSDGRVINVGQVVGEKGEKGEAGLTPEFRWQGTKLCFKLPDETWECVELKGESGTSIVGAGGIGQPIVTKLLTQNQGVNVNSRTEEIDFVGDVTVTKTGNTSVKVAINRRDMTWFTVVSNTETIINTGYVANSASQIDLLLPEECEVGDKVRILGFGAGGFRVTQIAGQLIYFGNKYTTIGNSGSISTVQQKSVIEIVCVGAGNFMVTSSIGNFILT